MSEWCVLEGDCLEVLQPCPDNYFDSMVSDPPAGVSFMNRSWDSDKGGRDQWIAWLQSVMVEVKRTLKPGAHCLVWALPRTSHWTATALENAGLEVRDVITHHFGSGFPKSQDVGKFIDKLAGAEREVVGPRTYAGGQYRADKLDPGGHTHHEGWQRPWQIDPEQVELANSETAPATNEAKQWDGWGTALKPAVEHWILCRKPLAESSIARNVLAHGVGGLNIDGCRVNRASDDVPGWHQSGADGSKGFHPEACCHCSGTGKARFYSDGEAYTDGPEVVCAFCLGSGMTKQTFAIRPMSAEEIQERCGGKGRWPANLVLSHSEECEESQCTPDCPVAEMDRQSGVKRSGRSKQHQPAYDGESVTGFLRGVSSPDNQYADKGGASRFFPTFYRSSECLLCQEEIQTVPVNGAAHCSTPTNLHDDSVLIHVPSPVPRAYRGTMPSKSSAAHNAESISGSMPPTNEFTAPRHVPPCQPELFVQRVRSVEILCKRCETTIVHLFAGKEPDQDPDVQVGLDSMPERRRQILIQSLALFVETRHGIDTMPTIANLKMWFGYVQNAITKNIQTGDMENGLAPTPWKYLPKPSRSEKEKGLEGLPDSTLNRVNPGGLEHEPRFAPIQVKNNHPTVKGIPLCRWLCRLITPPGGRILDPFSGSGSIGAAAVTEGFNYVGIEAEPDYCEIARARIEHWAGKER